MDFVSLITLVFTILGIGIPILISLWIMHRQNSTEMKSFQAEMKSFHGRLCTLEERYLQMMYKIFEKEPKDK